MDHPNLNLTEFAWNICDFNLLLQCSCVQLQNQNSPLRSSQAPQLTLQFRFVCVCACVCVELYILIDNALLVSDLISVDCAEGWWSLRWSWMLRQLCNLKPPLSHDPEASVTLLK